MDACDEPLFVSLSATVPRWLIATVAFDGGPLAGAMSCTLPEDLAYSLFDAFSGRDPSEPLPAAHELDDLVGEFANMVCGAWLSRSAGDRVFRLKPPTVVRTPRALVARRRRVSVAISNRPVAIDLHLEPLPPGAGLGT